jgi:hypothetical protein
LAASFISNQAFNVGFWHFASFGSTRHLGRYWTKSGQRSAQEPNGSGANDPKRICDGVSEKRYCGNGAFEIHGAPNVAVSARARVVGGGAPGEAQTMTAQRVEGAQRLAHFCAAAWGPPGIEAGMTSSV